MQIERPADAGLSSMGAHEKTAHIIRHGYLLHTASKN